MKNNVVSKVEKKKEEKKKPELEEGIVYVFLEKYRAYFKKLGESDRKIVYFALHPEHPFVLLSEEDIKELKLDADVSFSIGKGEYIVSGFILKKWTKPEKFINDLVGILEDLLILPLLVEFDCTTLSIKDFDILESEIVDIEPKLLG